MATKDEGPNRARAETREPLILPSAPRARVEASSASVPSSDPSSAKEGLPLGGGEEELRAETAELADFGLEGAELAVDKFLKTLTPEEERPPNLEAGPTPLQYDPKKIHWWYERLADWMLANPDKYLKDAAVVFDVTPTWLYALQRSDTFQDYWTERSRAVSQTVEQKAQVLADRLLDSFHQDLDAADQNNKPLPTSTRLQILDVTMKRFGYGETRRSPPQPLPGAITQNNYSIGVVTPAELKQARGRLAQSQEAKRIAHTIEGEAALAVKLPSKVEVEV